MGSDVAVLEVLGPVVPAEEVFCLEGPPADARAAREVAWEGAAAILLLSAAQLANVTAKLSAHNILY